jgi:hypothetical protein
MQKSCSICGEPLPAIDALLVLNKKVCLTCFINEDKREDLAKQNHISKMSHFSKTAKL